MRLPLILSALLSSTAAFAQVPSVVTDVPAVHSLTAQVMGDLGAPEILLSQGSDPHHFQLRPSQARALSNADLVVWVGPKLTPWLERALGGVRPQGETVELINLEATHTQPFGAGRMGPAQDDHDAHADHEAHDDHDHAAHDAHKDHAEHAGHDHDEHAEHKEHEGHGDHDDHDHSGIDPHAWLSPENAAVWLGVIADELSHLDPENAATYAANAKAAQARLAATEAKVRATLAPVGQAPIVVFHDAYGYFSTHFGVNIPTTIALGDAAAPGAKHLAAVRETLEHSGAVCVFPEAQHDPAYVQTLVAGTDVKIGEALDPSGSSLRFGPDLYTALLSNLADTIAGCAAAQ